jgi:DNA-binding transcriptional regulator YiaG
MADSGINARTIRTARRRLGESQARFAARFGVHQSTLHRWETGGPPENGPVAMLIGHVIASLPRAAKPPARQRVGA